MTLADYFQPLGLNFLQSPIQLYPSPPLPTPPHPYSPPVHKVLQMFDYWKKAPFGFVTGRARGAREYLLFFSPLVRPRELVDKKQ